MLAPVGKPTSLSNRFAQHWGHSRFFTHSRDLDRSLDAALPLYNLNVQLTIILYQSQLFSLSASSTTRTSDLATQRLPLDNLIDQFLDSRGKPRSDLDSNTLLALYKDPATTDSTKAFIITFGLQSVPASVGLEFVRIEKDSHIRGWILNYCLAIRPTYSESVFDRLHAVGIDDALLSEFVEADFKDEQAVSESLHTWIFSSSAEDRILDILEREDSVLFRVPSLDAGTPQSITAWYQLIAIHLNTVLANSNSPLARARWQLLINELNRRISDIEARPLSPLAP